MRGGAGRAGRRSRRAYLHAVATSAPRDRAPEEGAVRRRCDELLPDLRGARRTVRVVTSSASAADDQSLEPSADSDLQGQRLRYDATCPTCSAERADSLAAPLPDAGQAGASAASEHAPAAEGAPQRPDPRRADALPFRRPAAREGLAHRRQRRGAHGPQAERARGQGGRRVARSSGAGVASEPGPRRRGAQRHLRDRHEDATWHFGLPAGCWLLRCAVLSVATRKVGGTPRRSARCPGNCQWPSPNRSVAAERRISRTRGLRQLRMFRPRSRRSV